MPNDVKFVCSLARLASSPGSSSLDMARRYGPPSGVRRQITSPGTASSGTSVQPRSRKLAVRVAAPVGRNAEVASSRASSATAPRVGRAGHRGTGGCRNRRRRGRVSRRRSGRCARRRLTRTWRRRGWRRRGAPSGGRLRAGRRRPALPARSARGTAIAPGSRSAGSPRRTAQRACGRRATGPRGRVGRAARRARCASRLVVVSLPAMSSRTQKLTSSSSDSGSSPSPPERTSRLTRSSPGWARRSSMTSAKKLLIAWIAASAPAGSGVIENALTIASLHARNCPNMSGGIPSSSAITRTGNGIARSRISSPALPCSTRPATCSRAMSVINGSATAIRLGVKPRATIRRSAVWTGGSSRISSRGASRCRVAGEGHGHQIAHPARRREQPGLAQHTGDVLVATDQPGVQQREVGESLGGADLGVGRIRIPEDDGIERVEDHERPPLTGNGSRPQVAVHSPPGSRAIRSLPERSASGGQVIGSTATALRRRSGGWSVSPVKTIR